MKNIILENIIRNMVELNFLCGLFVCLLTAGLIDGKISFYKFTTNISDENLAFSYRG